LLLSVCLSIGTAVTIPAFTISFAIIWMGYLLITVNARLLGYRLPLLPTMAFLGYCLTPLAVTVLLLSVLPNIWVIRLVLTAFGTGWAIFSALRLLEMDPALEERRILASYPFCLFYCLIAWLVMIV
jgi:hypothetical protein